MILKYYQQADEISIPFLRNKVHRQMFLLNLGLPIRK